MVMLWRQHLYFGGSGLRLRLFPSRAILTLSLGLTQVRLLSNRLTAIGQFGVDSKNPAPGISVFWLHVVVVFQLHVVFLIFHVFLFFHVLLLLEVFLILQAFLILHVFQLHALLLLNVFLILHVFLFRVFLLRAFMRRKQLLPESRKFQKKLISLR